MNIYDNGKNTSSCDGAVYEVSAENIEDFGFNPHPPEGYAPPEDFPNCCGFHSDMDRYNSEWFETFPHCCENHTKISRRRWFEKKNYEHVPERILNALSYTEHQINTKIGNEDWYEEITDYIVYCIQSFGTPPIGADRYSGAVQHYIKNNKPTKYEFPDWKRNRLLEFFEVSNSNSEDTDLNILYATFQRWVKMIPEISIFKSLKANLKGKVPMNLFLRDPKENRYLGTTSFSLRTKGELVELLVEITKNTLGAFNTPNLIKEGFIESKDEHQFDLISSQHLLKQESLLGAYSKGELKYVKVIKKWLANEKDYFKSIQPILETKSMSKKKTKMEDRPVTELIISREEFKKKLESRIEIGEKIFEMKVATQEDFDLLTSEFTRWNSYNSEFLKSSFNVKNNEYRKKYDDAGLWVGMNTALRRGANQRNKLEEKKEVVKLKINRLSELVDQIDLLPTQVSTEIEASKRVIEKKEMKDVFIVHGHDELAETKTARLISKLDLNPIILHEQASGSNTIIEKIEEYSENVGFGIILYTPDDIGGKNAENPSLKSRARQNVVFEHGYLIGKIGRGNVCALVKGDVETPGDISGVVYIKMDDAGAWELRVVKELHRVGYDVDPKKLF